MFPLGRITRFGGIEVAGGSGWWCGWGAWSWWC